MFSGIMRRLKHLLPSCLPTWNCQNHSAHSSQIRCPDLVTLNLHPGCDQVIGILYSTVPTLLYTLLYHTILYRIIVYYILPAILYLYYTTFGPSQTPRLGPGSSSTARPRVWCWERCQAAGSARLRKKSCSLDSSH